MVNFTKLAVVAFVGAATASPLDYFGGMLNKRQIKSWDNAGNARWPSVQTCYDALCRGGAQSYVERCGRILRCEKAKGGCEDWYCRRVEDTRYVNLTLPIIQ